MDLPSNPPNLPPNSPDLPPNQLHSSIELSQFSQNELETKVKELRNEGKYKEGITLGLQALQKFPKSYLLWNNVGNCFYSLNYFYEALVCYKKDIKFSPKGNEKGMSLNNYAVSWEKLNVLGLAEKYYRKAKEEGPSNYFFFINSGILLIMLGKIEEAKLISEEVSNLSLDDFTKSSYYKLKGYLSLMEGKTEEAEEFFESSLRLTKTQWQRDTRKNAIEFFKSWYKKEKIVKKYFSFEELSHHERMEQVKNLWEEIKNKNEIDFFDKIDFKEIKLGKKIGQGGFGTVHEAEWNSQKVAVKIIDLNKVEKPEYCLSEIALMSSFNHKFIMNLLGSGLNIIDAGNRKIEELFLIMPLMKGSLKSILFNLSAKKICEICIDICSGMEYLHRIGIIHRDLKPENCLIDNENHIIICDFGVSRIDSGTTLKTYTGTLQYMAPEVLTGKKGKKIAYEEAIDVYSFGVMLWEMTSKKEADSSISSKKTFQLWGASTTLSLNDCDKRFHSILKKTLIEDPTQRITFLEILESFVDILEEIGIQNPF